MKNTWPRILSLHIHPFVELFFLFIPFLQIIIALYLTTSLIQAAPAGQTYNVITGKDMYISAIRQGSQGHWTTEVPFTTNETQRVFGFNFFFILLGQINRIFQFPPITMYFISQILSAVFLYLITYLALRLLFPKALALASYVFILGMETGIPLTLITKLGGDWTPVETMYQYQQVIERHMGLPHHAFAKGIGILFFVLTILFIHKPTRIKGILIASFSAIGGFILPPFTIVFLLCAFPVIAIHALIKKNIKSLLIAGILIVVPFIISTVFLKMEFNKIPALEHYTVSEKTWWIDQEVAVRYLHSFLLFIPWLIICFIATIFSFKTMKKNVLLLIFTCLSWIVLPLLYIFVSHYSWFPLANGRLTDGYQYIPAGILAGVGVLWLTSLFASRFRQTVFSLCLITACSFSLLLTRSYVKATLEVRSSPWTNIYPVNDFWKAVHFLETVPKGSGIMLHPLFSDMLVGYTDIHIFVSQSGLAYPYYDKNNYLYTIFFQNQMTEEEAKKFLHENKIHYILFTDQERLLAASMPYPELVTQVFHTPEVSIYKVK